MWGANDPELHLARHGEAAERQGPDPHAQPRRVRRGKQRPRPGPESRGSPAPARVRSRAMQIPLISEPTLDQSVDRRIEIFNAAAGERGVRAYVNIGGGSASIGNAQSANLIAPGHQPMLQPYNWTQRGALHHYAAKRVPFIHLLNIEEIARRRSAAVARDGPARWARGRSSTARPTISGSRFRPS